MQGGTCHRSQCPALDKMAWGGWVGARPDSQVREIGVLEPVGTQEPSCIWEGTETCYASVRKELGPVGRTAGGGGGGLAG